MTIARSTLLLILLAIGIGALTGCGPGIAPDAPLTLGDLEIEVADTSREVAYTNTQAGFYYTESNGDHRNGWQGWHVRSVKLLSDYLLDLDGRPLDRATSDYARVWPHEFTRSYHEGVQETFVLLDSVNAFLIELGNLRSRTVGLSLVLDASARIESSGPSDAGTLVFSPFSNDFRTSRPDVPGWIGLTAPGTVATSGDTITARGMDAVKGVVRAPVTDGQATFLVVAGSTPEDVRRMLRDIGSDPGSYRARRASRLQTLLDHGMLRTSYARFDKAVAWALLSMDALVMDQGRKGIFAGLPWFSNYWGRDTFISLPGATLVTGRFAEAREILRSFAGWQEVNPRSPNEGRIPNLATPTSIAYNTTDGTPWFILGVYDYVRASADTAFIRQIYPVIRRAVEGPLRHMTDDDVLLEHGDAETWMDAVGPAGPWSPRGNRANDIQALWYRQLSASSSMASLLGERKDAARWGLLADEVLYSFRSRFIDADSSRLFDHLNADGSPDRAIRPNQLFALDLVPTDSIRAAIFRRLTGELVYDFGVGSLSPYDDNFHPYHHYEPNYVQDAAYHNGIVWTWLAGPWIDQAVKMGQTDLAYAVTDNLTHQILDRGAVGTISELLDAAPRPGETEPRLSGTFSQAWSLAEYLRVLYQTYLGVSMDALNKQVWLRPRLPKALPSASFTTVVGTARLSVSYVDHGASASIHLSATSDLFVSASWVFPGNIERTLSVELLQDRPIEVTMTADGFKVDARDGDMGSVDSQTRVVPTFPGLRGLRLAEPLLREGLRSMRGPSYELIPHDVATTQPADASVIVDALDPAGDDKGTGSYTYPSTPSLLPGSLDLRSFRVAQGTGSTTFELGFSALSNPGWHPEYGFQLTYAAIAIDKDGTPGSGRTTVGQNAAYSLPDGRGYESIIYVGGGVQVEDASETIEGAYLPRQGDEKRPLGNAGTATIRFTIPASMIGTPTGDWRYYVLIGCQDDHGGAGIGEFRSVERDGGEWIGGGKTRSSDPNIYDTLVYP